MHFRNLNWRIYRRLKFSSAKALFYRLLCVSVLLNVNCSVGYHKKKDWPTLFTVFRALHRSDPHLLLDDDRLAEERRLRAVLLAHRVRDCDGVRAVHHPVPGLRVHPPVHGGRPPEEEDPQAHDLHHLTLPRLSLAKGKKNSAMSVCSEKRTSNNDTFISRLPTR